MGTFSTPDISADSAHMAPSLQIGKRTHFWEINIFAKIAEFVICVKNL